MRSLGNRTPEVPSEACAANEIRWDQSLGGGAACTGVARGGGGADAVMLKFLFVAILIAKVIILQK